MTDTQILLILGLPVLLCTLGTLGAYLEYMRLLFAEKRLKESATNLDILSEVARDINKIKVESSSSYQEHYMSEDKRSFPIPKVEKDGRVYDYDKYSCKHLKGGHLRLVVVGQNEGGYDSVGMCGECLQEILNRELKPLEDRKVKE